MQQDIVQFVGFSDNGLPIFDVALSLPDPVPNDIPPTHRMIDAVGSFYDFDAAELTDSQAHTLLCARDYGRQAAARIFDQTPIPLRERFAQLIAVYLMADDERRADTVAWAERRFALQAEGSAIARTKWFGEVAGWIGAVVRDSLG